MRKVAGCLLALIVVLSMGIASSAPAGQVTIQFPSGFNFALSGGNLYDASGPAYGATTAVNDGVDFFYNSVLVGTIPSGALADLLITGIPPIPTNGTVSVSGGPFHFDLLTPGYGPNSGVKLTFNQASVSYLGSGQFFLSFTTTGTVAQQEMDYPFGQFWFDVGPNTYVNFAISGKVANPQYNMNGELISFTGVTSPSGNLNGPGGYIPEPASLVIWSVLGAAVCVVAWRARARK